jgi:hypothetical protein
MAITDRRHERRAFLYPAWIDRGRGLDPIPCRIEDVSRLAVENADHVPEQFRLLLSLTSARGRLCIVRRRFPDAAGIQFIKVK